MNYEGTPQPKPVAESAKLLWQSMEELIQENLFENFLEPREEEVSHMLMTLVLLAAEIHRTVLSQTSGPVRESIYNAWRKGLTLANQARQIYEASSQTTPETPAQSDQDTGVDPEIPQETHR